MALPKIKVSVPKVSMPKIGGTIGQVGSAVKKAAGDYWSTSYKQPVQATAQAVQTKSIKPISEYVGNVWSKSVKQPFQQAGQETGILPKSGGSQAGAPQAAVAAPDYSKFNLNLTGGQFAGPAAQQDMMGMISANETPEAAQQRISQQYGAMGSLAKMREGSQRQSEQSAIARRLAASGMGASGAGMRMQQQQEQAAGRRAAETQLGLSAEQAGAERQAMDTTTARNLQREQMRLGAAESAAGQNLRERMFQADLAKEEKAFAREGEVIAENQKIAREIQRYNEQGLIGQLGQDIFGGTAKKFSTKNVSFTNPYGFAGKFLGG